MKVLVIDVGGTNVKVLATGQTERRKFPSGPKLTPQRMVSEVKAMTKDWEYDVVSLGVPAPVDYGHLKAEPRNLSPGWVSFDFKRAFARPVRIMNDAAMQALGSYEKGRMLFLGLGTGLGSCAIVYGKVKPLELSVLPYKKGTYEDYVGRARLKIRGRKKWTKDVAEAISYLKNALRPHDVVLGGGNARKLTGIPPGCRVVTNANAFIGGFRMWEETERKSDKKEKSQKREESKPEPRRKAS